MKLRTPQQNVVVERKNQTLEEMARGQKLGVYCEYKGIPIKVDYENPELLEVGYMVKWMENNL